MYYLRIDFYNLNLGPYSEKDAFINSRGTKWKANRNQMKSGQLCYFIWDAQGIVGRSGGGLRTVAYTADSALWHSFWGHVIYILPECCMRLYWGIFSHFSWGLVFRRKRKQAVQGHVNLWMLLLILFVYFCIFNLKVWWKIQSTQCFMHFCYQT